MLHIYFASLFIFLQNRSNWNVEILNLNFNQKKKNTKKQNRTFNFIKLNNSYRVSLFYKD